MIKISDFLSRLKKISLRQNLVLIFSALIIGFGLAFGLQLILAWVGPTIPPPEGGPVYEFLHTGSEEQSKAGDLMVHDVYLSNPKSGSPKWASTLGDIPFTEGCIWKNYGERCPDTHVVVQVNSGQAYCCKAASPQAPVEIKVESFDLTVSGRGAGGETWYSGQATIVISDTFGLPVENATIYGHWSGATDRCDDGATTCSEVTGEDGRAIISSTEVDSGTAYETGEFCFEITNVTGGILSEPLPSPKCVSVPPPVGDSNCHVASIEVSRQVIETWKVKATAKVKIVNEAGIPLQGQTVTGSWSDSYIGNVSGETNEIGEVIFTTAEVYCWKVLPEAGPKFTFTVTNVTGPGPIYDPAQNTETTDYASVTRCPIAPLFVKSISGRSICCESGQWGCVNYKSQVTVTILDQPVEEVTVKGQWSNGYSGTVTGTTDANGNVTFTTPSCGQNPKCFAVTSLEKAGRIYADQLNLVEMPVCW